MTTSALLQMITRNRQGTAKIPLHLSGISFAITLVLEQSNEIHYGQLVHKQHSVYKLIYLKGSFDLGSKVKENGLAAILDVGI